MARTLWLDKYFIEEVGSIDSRASLSPTNSVGVGNEVLVLFPRLSPEFAFPSIITPNPKSVDVPDFLIDEMIYTIKSPATVSYSMNLDSYVLSLFGKSFFQGGTQSTPGAGVYLYTMIPYTSMDPTVFLSTVRLLNTVNINLDRISLEIWGGIVSGLSISGNTGSIMGVTADIQGLNFNRTNLLGPISNTPRLIVKFGYSDTIPSANLTINRESSYATYVSLDGTPDFVADDATFTDPDSLAAGTVEVSEDTGHLNFSSADLVSYANQNIMISYAGLDRNNAYSILEDTVTSIPSPLKFQDMVFNLDSTDLKVGSISLTLNNNPSPKFYDNDYGYGWDMGRINGTLAFDIPLSETNYESGEAFYNYLNSTVHYIQIYWGAASPISENQIALRLNGKLKSLSIKEANQELFCNISLDLVSDNTYNSVNILAAYSDSKLDRS